MALSSGPSTWVKRKTCFTSLAKPEEENAELPHRYSGLDVKGSVGWRAIFSQLHSALQNTPKELPK